MFKATLLSFIMGCLSFTSTSFAGDLTYTLDRYKSFPQTEHGIKATYMRARDCNALGNNAKFSCVVFEWDSRLSADSVQLVDGCLSPLSSDSCAPMGFGDASYRYNARQIMPLLGNNYVILNDRGADVGEVHEYFFIVKSVDAVTQLVSYSRTQSVFIKWEQRSRSISY